jgi:hypothetical protein
MGVYKEMIMVHEVDGFTGAGADGPVLAAGRAA